MITMWLARNVRRSGIGRRLVSIRDNEDNARAFTVRASVVKTQGFLLAGFVAMESVLAELHGLGSGGVGVQGQDLWAAEAVETDLTHGPIMHPVPGGGHGRRSMVGFVA